ncbi:hypothetical protein HPB51_028692 [Rhipicephalus microplus]|uniref:Myb/SANT-like DNA-binding domain-containing protein n=1 Tax=Rhipicephalus microplus TaxID=6941 RepID=A0A9J6CWL3_RHIMP|nr:hypothetical protein HPB51_028692 [Rhipicephalus microplus]
MANSADQAAGAPRKRQRLQWSEADTWSLIRLWEDNPHSLRAQKHNGEVYASIVAAPTSAGVSRTKDQVLTKIENLTHTYRAFGTITPVLRVNVMLISGMVAGSSSDDTEVDAPEFTHASSAPQQQSNIQDCVHRAQKQLKRQWRWRPQKTEEMHRYRNQGEDAE